MLNPEKQRELAAEDRQLEEQRKHIVQDSSSLERSKRKKHLTIGISIVVVLLLVGSLVYAFRLRPGKWDDFAKCLTEKGAVMYGAIDWCQYTKQQVGMFGRSFKHVNYKDFPELPGIKKTPTWVYAGEWYDGVQSFERLAAVTGCSFSGGKK